MQLGEMIRHLSDETVAAEALVACGDLALVAKVSAAAAADEETIGDYAASAVRRFTYAAGDEDWLKLMTALERASNPGLAALATMVTWSVDLDQRQREPVDAHRCSCGNGDCG